MGIIIRFKSETVKTIKMIPFRLQNCRLRMVRPSCYTLFLFAILYMLVLY